MLTPKAIIEIGSNSIKFCVAQLIDNDHFLVIEDNVYITRIAENLSQTGLISTKAMKRNEQTIKMLCQKAHESGITDIAAVGTMALRKAKNADVFIQNIKEQCHVSIQILSGDDEARLSYKAAMNTIPNISGSCLVFDSGGGSTEFTFGSGNTITKNLSIDIGAVYITEKYFPDNPIDSDKLFLAKQYILDQFQKNNLHKPIDQLIGLGGAITTMAAVKQGLERYHSESINGSILNRKDIQDQIQNYASKTLDQRKTILGLQTGREDIILAGACIIDGIMDHLKCDQVTVCDRGLRYGLIA